MPLNAVMLPNLGRGFDIGINTPGSIEVDIGVGLAYSGNTIIATGAGAPDMTALSPAPSLSYLSGSGWAADLTNVSATLIGQSPHALNYMIRADWIGGAGGQTVLQIDNIPAGKAHSISFGMARDLDNRVPNEIAIRGQTLLVFRNSFAGNGANGPMKITVFVSVAP